MPKIAVVGANGQVGAELCILLARIPGVVLVPVCRNPTGSAFLRYSGIPCRHGRPADPLDARHLFGDCDAIINCALGSGTPAEIRTVDARLIHNLFQYSAAGAKVIHCSTLMVHGDPRPGSLLRARDAYGRAKLAAERRVLTESKRTGKSAYILRLGHVCGPLQNITDKIRMEITHGQVVLPEKDVASNTVYTVTIVDAIMSILLGKEEPGAFDLTNSPQWSWRQVYEYECLVLGCAFAPRLAFEGGRKSMVALFVGTLMGTIGRWLALPFVRRRLDGWLAVAPASFNSRAQAIWFKMTARREISELYVAPNPAPELSWVRLDRRTLAGLRPTRDLLDENPHRALPTDSRNSWPEDLALFVESQTTPY